MLDPSLIASILVVHWLVTMSPGANTVLVAQAVVASGRTNALAVIAGICASGAIWVTSAALGLKAVFLAFPWLYVCVSYVGAAYLVWLGVKLLRSRPKLIEGQPAARVPQCLAVSYARGFVSNITNPKTLIYFSSVFGTFMPPDAGPATVVAVVLVTWFCNFGWYGGAVVPAVGHRGPAALCPDGADDQPRSRACNDPVRSACGGDTPAVTGTLRET